MITTEWKLRRRNLTKTGRGRRQATSRVLHKTPKQDKTSDTQSSPPQETHFTQEKNRKDPKAVVCCETPGREVVWGYPSKARPVPSATPGGSLLW